MFDFFSSIMAPYRGWVGEREVQVLTDFSTAVGPNSITMHDICLSWPNGKTVQIDELIIAQSGIYVIEVKNYKGWIFGNINQEYWTQCLTTGFRGVSIKNKLYNPIMQNQGHIRCLKNVLSEFPYVPYHSVVVFSNEATFKNVSYDSTVHLINMSDLKSTLNSIDRDFKEVVPVSDILDIKKVIDKNISVSDSKGHDAYVKEVQDLKQKGQLNRQAKCPLCGAKLVVRTSKNGPNAGSQFIGCSSYPKCRYTRPVD